VTGIRLTHIGGPTVLIEAVGWRILTDPTFDPPGQTYKFGWGTKSTKLSGPALAPDDLGPIDAVLLSHDHHADNLDDAGRALVATAPTVITTTVGARRLGPPARGLDPWEATTLAGMDSATAWCGSQATPSSTTASAVLPIASTSTSPSCTWARCSSRSPGRLATP
jgi:L-ascorbate metabolism protein UlaG (beta-lactamase superfamily)